MLLLQIVAALLSAAPLRWTVLPDDIRMTTGRKDAETTVATDGKRLFLATGTAQSLLRWQLTKNGIATPGEDISAVQALLHPTDVRGFDNQLVRVRGGDLLLLRAGGTKAPLDPKPEWWDYNDGQRGLLLFWRSSDGGKTWKPSKIDAQSLLDGKCAYPQEVTGKDGKVVKWFGGFDRPDMYADPFNGNVYVTVSIDAGSAPPWNEKHWFYHMILLVSRNRGKTWDKTPIVWDGEHDSSYRPLAMTSTPSGRLFLAHATAPYDPKVGFTPMVYWVDPPWNRISGAVAAWYGETGARGCSAVEPDKAGLPIRQPGVLAPTVSRVRAGPRRRGDVVRVSYMALDEQGRQVQRVVIVRVTKDGKATVTPSKTFVAEDPKGSVLQATFVEPDRKDDDTALLYWMETAPGSQTMLARGVLVTGESDWSAPFDLSLKDGKRRTWTPHGEWLGDYMKGTALYRGRALTFIAQWPESAPPDVPLHATIITVSR